MKLLPEQGSSAAGCNLSVLWTKSFLKGRIMNDLNLIPIPEGMETALLALSDGALEQLPVILKTYFPGKKPLLTADGNTWRAAGERVAGLIAAAGMEMYPPVILPADPRPQPELTLSRELAAGFPADAVPVAVGSGVINDLVKCAAGIAGMRYCCVPTAASVDGYTSCGGAMHDNGFKCTIPCPAPYAVVADTAVLASAPPEMLSAGYSDLLTKVPAGADWLLAAAMDIEPVRQDVWEVVQKDLRKWLSDPHCLGDIFMGLAATGFSMQMYRESRPASGADHLFSHVWEMEGLQYRGEDVSHGFKVGIGLLASTALLEFVVKYSWAEVAPLVKAPVSREFRAKEVEELAASLSYGREPAIKVAMEKFLDGDDIIARRRLIAERWDVMRPALAKQLYTRKEAEKMLLAAGCPVKPGEIGLDRKQYIHGIYAAQLIRKRYTVLDMLYEAGLLDAAVAELP